MHGFPVNNLWALEASQRCAEPRLRVLAAEEAYEEATVDLLPDIVSDSLLNLRLTLQRFGKISCHIVTELLDAATAVQTFIDPHQLLTADTRFLRHLLGFDRHRRVLVRNYTAHLASDCVAATSRTGVSEDTSVQGDAAGAARDVVRPLLKSCIPARPPQRLLGSQTDRVAASLYDCVLDLRTQAGLVVRHSQRNALVSDLDTLAEYVGLRIWAARAVL